MKGPVTRRGWLGMLSAGAVGGILGGVISPAEARGKCALIRGNLADLVPTQGDSPDLVLHKLMLGNTRYVENRPIPHNIDTDEFLETTLNLRLAERQRPAVMILSCVDSRVVPEFVFDQPRAAVFVGRVAGSFATTELVGSFEYCSRVLGDPPAGEARVLVVLGHSGCGAVSSTIADIRGQITDQVIRASSIPTLLDGLRADVQRAISEHPGASDAALLKAASEEAARGNAARLAAQGPILAARVAAGALRVVPAYYDIETGQVTLL